MSFKYPVPSTQYPVSEVGTVNGVYWLLATGYWLPDSTEGGSAS